MLTIMDICHLKIILIKNKIKMKDFVELYDIDLSEYDGKVDKDKFNSEVNHNMICFKDIVPKESIERVSVDAAKINLKEHV